LVALIINIYNASGVYSKISDSLLIDTSFIADSQKIAIDSTQTDSTDNAVLDAPIDYQAKDSILYSLDNKHIYLYGEAKIKYGKMDLTAEYIEINMDDETIYAKGLPDSSGQLKNKPVFVEGSDTYNAEEMKYNFKTKKGIIKNVMTNQQNGYLHAETTKRQANTEIHLAKGKYTTCNAPHPHFYIALTEAKAIPNDKIVSGPAYLVIEDVPIYFPLLPFGFFPNRKGHTSGLIMPNYGEEERRGFYLQNFGYYFAFNDYIDYKITGDFFTKGTWGTHHEINYRKRYRFNGGFSFSLYSNAQGDIDLPQNYYHQNDFSLQWRHSQDAKANPYRTFSSNVNISTSSYSKMNIKTPSAHLNNIQSSNIAFSKRWPNKQYNFSANISHSQNILTKDINFTAPSLSFNSGRYYPFQKKFRTGKMKWYEKIELSYSALLENKLKSKDTLLFRKFQFTENQFGFKHDIPVRVNFKALKFFNIAPQISYSGRIYTEKTVKHWVNVYDENGNYLRKEYKDSKVKGLYYAHSFAPSVSLSANPTLYGMYQFKKGMKIQAIRHVIDPSISFSYVPDLSKIPFYPNYYVQQTDSLLNPIDKYYSQFETGIYGTPTTRKQSGILNFSLRNNVEMKYLVSNDTSVQTKKIKIIDNLNMGISYNPFAEGENTPKWSDINISTSNRLFKDKIDIRFTSTASIYSLDSTGKRIDYNHFVWQTSDKIVRFTRASISVSTSFSSKQAEAKKEENERIAYDIFGERYSNYVDFSVPWQISFDYNLIYSKMLLEPVITQTFSFNGNINLTPKWKITMRSGYDFDKKQLTYTEVSIFRDLHCWHASFSWVPFGYMKSYTFTIQANESMLQDLKWIKRDSWFDNR